MNKFTNDQWLEDSNRRLKKGVWGKRIATTFSIIVYTALLFAIGIVLWIAFLTPNEFNKETGVYIPDTFISLINGEEAVVSEMEDGTFSARVEYQNGNLKKIVSVNWE